MGQEAKKGWLNRVNRGYLSLLSKGKEMGSSVKSQVKYGENP